MSENYTDDTVTISRGEYEDFVRDRHTVELICEIIRRGRCVSLPLLKVLVGLQDSPSDEEPNYIEEDLA
ncbi:MAG TPA: hypothetical protein IAB44_06340 [Candidatus Limivivens intestinipullorum]|uniref:Uncharacterized protein n=1 Tax=Candidatus Limivivens intestinipullorum TaxID=2840858 RepID=A0A9D1ES26_9FIRM|nr:hypothetical protein [Candidatus Limivivens intestinipullorum]